MLVVSPSRKRPQDPELLLEVWEQFRTTIVFVTHDIDEALLLSDRIIVMQAQPGRIHEEITVAFERPRTTDIIAFREFLRLKQRFLQLLRSDRRGDTLARLSPLGDWSCASRIPLLG
ncbi:MULTISPECIES: hypothetical protein [Mesorhizobium]|uniref:hypothetical protein n=1 Tax=Mesorhizobium TaxID=68287 RepID=UPI001397708A|nr:MULTISPECIES: hypothetical protein [Mesorhizobium]QIA20329.1 hypothetical protein A9K68_029950 [Mesorhizobium sp. AA22]